MDLVALMAVVRAASSPKASLMALVSQRSPSMVLVACGLI